MSRRTQLRVLVVVTLGWVVWAAFSLTGGSQTLTVRVVDDTGSPIPEAVVADGPRQLGLTDESGVVQVDSIDGPIDVSAPGHMAATVRPAAAVEGRIDAILKARVLRGTVVDPSGRPVPGATVDAGTGSAVSDGQGRFAARGAEPGTVEVTRPAWEPTSFEWAGGPGDTEVTIEPRMVKAVHITGEAVEQRLDYFVDMARTSELNALMIDLKDESGLVQYRTELSSVASVGADADRYDLASVVSTARAEDLYLIGRLVAFQDPVAAQNAPELSVWDEATGVPLVSDDQYFLDPTDPDARDYVMELAVEACGAGLDEVQFDYIRFPDYRPESATFDGGVTVDVRTETIRSFLADAVSVLHPMGCAVGADIFGFVTSVQDDGGIGQNWVDLTSVVDVASPMVYPSHYDTGWFGYDDPGEHPAVVVDRALGDGMDRLPRQVVVRPWLQDFGYDDGDVRAQIDVTESYGLGWMLWNATSNVSTDAIRPAPDG